MHNKNFWFGVIAGLIVVALVATDLYARFKVSPVSQPVPSNTPESSAIASASPVSAIAKPSAKPASPKPTPKASTATPTPTPQPKADFFLQSHNQTLVPDNINATEFVESTTYPRMKLETDFGVNNAVTGSTVEYRVYEDGVSQLSQLRTISSTSAHFIDTYYAKSRNAGTHTVKMIFNENHTIVENNYANNEYTFTFKIIPETQPPTFTIDGPYIINGQTCIRWVNLQDNVSVYTDVWAKWKIDDTAWSNKTSENPYGCISGMSGSSHIYYVHAEDRNGNVREDSRNFTLY